MPDGLIRTIRPEDNAAIAAIIRQVMTEFGTVGPGYSIEDEEVDHMYEAYQDAATSRYFVLEIDGRLVGGGGIAPLARGGAEVCELRKMYFLPEVRGLGWGRRMVELCLDTARELGYRKCYLETVARMQTANVLYRKMGFRQLEGRMGDTGHSSCEIHMVKLLT